MNRTPRRILLALLLAVAAAACQKAEWQTKDISGFMQPLAFRLTSETGDPVTAEDFGGKATLLYFGYSSCPDICPTTLARLAADIRTLKPARQERIQVLFVSVDPKRDDPARLRAYTDAFGPEFIGLTGTEAELRELAKRYRVTFGYGEPDADGNYIVSHSAAVFGFDASGKARIMIQQSDSPDAVSADLARLASE